MLTWGANYFWGSLLPVPNLAAQLDWAHYWAPFPVLRPKLRKAMGPRETGGTFSGHGNQIRYKMGSTGTHSVPRKKVPGGDEISHGGSHYTMADRFKGS